MRSLALGGLGNGEVVRNHLYVPDLADALAAETETRHGVFQHRERAGASSNELISRVVGERPTVEYQPARDWSCSLSESRVEP